MVWKILGVFAGLITDIGLSLVLGLLFGVAIGIYFISQGVPTHDLAERANALTKTTPALLASGGLGCFGSLVGGVVTGWIARTHRVLCGAIMGFFSVAASVPFWKGEPLWFNLLGVVLTLAMATAGGCLADVIFGRKLGPSPPPG